MWSRSKKSKWDKYVSWNIKPLYNLYYFLAIKSEPIGTNKLWREFDLDSDLHISIM